MRKIGILTYFTDPPYFNDINPGMNLQAFSVCKAIEEQYPDYKVELIRYHSWFGIWRIYLSSMTVKTLVLDIKQFLKYYKFIKEKFKKSKNAMVSRNIEKSLKFINMQNYDAIFVGSDTVLELFRNNKDEISAYWLSPKIKAKKFLIAPSSRDASYGKLSETQKLKLKESINEFSMLGVRDISTYTLIEKFISKSDERLKIIPDPTFFMRIENVYANKYLTTMMDLNVRKKIICFHLLKTNKFANDLAMILKSKGYTIVSLRPAKYADFILKDLSPLEFAGIFKFFTLTITHRFHDTVFCLKNLSPVVLYNPGPQYKDEYGYSKQSFLMEEFGIKDTNYIENIDEMKIEHIMIIIENSIERFKYKKKEINQKLVNNRNMIKEYLTETRKYI